MQNISLRHLYCLLLVICSGTLCAQTPPKIQGWNILSDSYKDAFVTIAAAPEYHINHLQLSHDLVMDLCEMKVQAKRAVVNELVTKAHAAGINEVVLRDHALYSLKYYPEQFKSGTNGIIDLDNQEFWA